MQDKRFLQIIDIYVDSFPKSRILLINGIIFIQPIIMTRTEKNQIPLTQKKKTFKTDFFPAPLRGWFSRTSHDILFMFKL